MHRLILLLIYVAGCLIAAALTQVNDVSIADGSMNNACPFYGARVPSAQDGLVNCTWYNSNACCVRTEVTSVFNSMLPLDTPESKMDVAKAKHCRNLINYMMCYFCDPNQANFYTTKLNICADFCTDVYTYCSEASYDGLSIGDQFTSGQEFCEAQQFEVVKGESGCFKFDPTVFDSSSVVSVSALLLLSCILLSYFSYLGL